MMKNKVNHTVSIQGPLIKVQANSLCLIQIFAGVLLCNLVEDTNVVKDIFSAEALQPPNKQVFK